MKKNNISKIIITIIAVLFIIPAISAAHQETQQNQGNNTINNFEVTYTIYFSEHDVSFDKLLGYDTVHIQDEIYQTEAGKPMIPSKEIKVALPAEMKVEQVEVIKTTSIGLPGNYFVFPAQPVQRTSDTDTPVEFFQPDEETYGSLNSYPSKTIEFVHQTDLAGQNIAVLTLHPLHYTPPLGKLSLCTSIRFTITGTNGYECVDYLPHHLSEYEKTYYTNRVKEMVINPNDVSLQTNSNPMQPLPTTADDYDYIIITKDDWVDDFESLANWKTQKGVPAKIVTTSWIYSQYSGSNQQKIRSFIIDAYNDWGALYFLLGGDTDTIPYQIKYLLGDSIPSDTYYSDYDDDWTCEVHVGRAPVRTTSQIDTFTNKILTYEQNPPLTSYAKNAFFCGFDLYSYNSGEGEDCKKSIKSNYLPSDWTYQQEYDSEVGTHKSDVIAYLNQGNNLVNHADHSYTDSMGVGSTNHGDSLSVSDVSNLNNGNRQSILYTMGCYACNFEDYQCIGEAFVQNTNGGGLAFIGNSRYGWYNPHYYNTLSFLYDIYFFRSLLDQDHYILGDCFSDHKNDGPTSNDYYQYVFTELTLLGDPELPIWMDDPTEIDDVDYPTSVGTISQTFSVTVKDGGSPLIGARVCIQKQDDDLYEYGFTDSTGKISFIINPTTEGTLQVTVSSRDYLPWEGTSTVEEGGGTTDTIFLAGLIDNFLNHEDSITCNAKIVFSINLGSFGINIYSSNEEIYLTKDYQGYIGSGIVIGLFKGFIN